MSPGIASPPSPKDGPDEEARHGSVTSARLESGVGVLSPQWTRYPSDVDRDEMLRVLRAFDQEGLEYVLIGAAAMGFHGLVRATEDLDIFIRATAENVERLKRAFRAAYDNDPNVDDIKAADLLGDYPAVRYYPPSGDLYFDVMTRLGEVASFDTVSAQTKSVEGISVRVATPAALFRLKKDTVRPLDRQDAEVLRREFDLEDD